MAVKQYSDILLQITNFNQPRTALQRTHRHECLSVERYPSLLSTMKLLTDSHDIDLADFRRGFGIWN